MFRQICTLLILVSSYATSAEFNDLQRPHSVFTALRPSKAGLAWLAAPPLALSCPTPPVSGRTRLSFYDRVLSGGEALFAVRTVSAQAGCGGHYFKIFMIPCNFCSRQFAGGGSNYNTGYIPNHHYICNGQCPEDILCSNWN